MPPNVKLDETGSFGQTTLQGQMIVWTFTINSLSITPHNFVANLILIHKLKRRPTIQWL